MYIPITERKFLKKSIKSDYVKTELDITLERVNSSVGNMREVTDELVQKVDDKLQEVDITLVDVIEKVDNAIYDLQNIEIPQGEKGDKGDDGETPDIQAITKDILARIPTVDEEKIVSKVLKAIPKNKPSLKIIQESIDKEALLQDIINSPKLKIKTSNVEGLDLNLKALDKRYIHGGGDTIAAGTNVTITRNSNGDKVINATGGTTITSYAETPSGTIDGVNNVFTTAHTMNFVNGLYMNGQFIHPADYGFSGTTITFVTAPDISYAGLPFTVVYY